MWGQISSKSILGIALLGITGLTGCSFNRNSKAALTQEKPTVVATHSIICNFVETIAKASLDLTCLVDGSQDPHTYRPTPGDRQALERAQLILYGGYQLEPQIIGLVETTATAAPKIAVYETAVTEPILAEHHHHEDEEHREEEHREPISETEASQPTITGNLAPETNTTEKPPSEPETETLPADPHVWHDVENAVAILKTIQTALTQLSPSNAALYLQNSVALEDRLRQLNIWIEEQIATIPEAQKILVTVHDSFNYYVNAYEFKDYLSLQGLSDAETPTASQLRELAIQVRQQEIPTIFAESTASDRVIASVAREAGVNLAESRLFADGLGEADSYIEIMVANTCTIVNGLGGNCRPLEN
ncbi:metal ABC transporter solute-binding protein, Zn/Mn family [Myxosarcina sp. GI1(2024)]